MLRAYFSSTFYLRGCLYICHIFLPTCAECQLKWRCQRCGCQDDLWRETTTAEGAQAGRRPRNHSLASCLSLCLLTSTTALLRKRVEEQLPRSSSAMDYRAAHAQPHPS